MGGREGRKDGGGKGEEALRGPQSRPRDDARQAAPQLCPSFFDSPSGPPRLSLSPPFLLYPSILPSPKPPTHTLDTCTPTHQPLSRHPEFDGGKIRERKAQSDQPVRYKWRNCILFFKNVQSVHAHQHRMWVFKRTKQKSSKIYLAKNTYYYYYECCSLTSGKMTCAFGSRPSSPRLLLLPHCIAISPLPSASTFTAALSFHLPPISLFNFSSIYVLFLLLLLSYRFHL